MDKRDVWNTEEKHVMRQQIEAALRMLSNYKEDLSKSAVTCKRQAKLWGRFNLFLGLPSAVLAAVAGVGAFSDLFGTVVVGATALLSAALTSVIAFFQPGEKKRENETKADAFEALVNDLETYLELDVLEPEVRSNAYYFFKDFQARLKLVEKGEPYPDRWQKGEPVGPGGLDYSWLMKPPD